MEQLLYPRPTRQVSYIPPVPVGGSGMPLYKSRQEVTDRYLRLTSRIYPVNRFKPLNRDQGDALVQDRDYNTLLVS